MIKDRIRYIDIKAIIVISILFIPALIYRLFNRNIWLCSERRNEARDNGFWMYKYIREKHPKQKCYYVICKNAPDRSRIQKYKTIIDWGSIKHFFILIATRVRLSAHVDTDTPNSRVTNFMDRHRLLRNKRIFLQHGITKDKISFGYYKISRADLFICGAIPEYNFCKREFGYPLGNVVLTGFARFDGLNNDVTKKQILLMPTWRVWLNNANETQIKDSLYFKMYNSLINSKKLSGILKRYGYKLILYTHSDMRKFEHLFTSTNSDIIVANDQSFDAQSLINESKILVTDYSSVAFDFAYLKKTTIYYHFDYERYRAFQHPEGYFSYNENGFGPIAHTENEVVDYINKSIIDNFKNNEYLEKVDNFFKYFDKNNCLRIYDEIKKL